VRLPFHNDRSRLHDYAAFTDESGITRDRYMLIGGLSCSTYAAQGFSDRFHAVQLRNPYPQDSLQWKNIIEGKLGKYKAAVDLFLELNAAQKLDFTCLIAERKLIDHARFSAGDGELSFQKMAYLAFMAILRKYGQPEVFRAFHGQRTSKFLLQEFMGIFNSGATKDFTIRGFYRPMRQMEYMKVENSPLHQMADLVLGATSWHWNRAKRGAPETPKGQMAKYIESACPLSRLDKPSPKTGVPHFHVWEIDLKARLASLGPKGPSTSSM